MIKEYAEFERKRRNGNPDEEKRSSVRKSYAEFIRNNPGSDKTRQETLLEPSKSTSKVTSPSTPAPFKAADKMYGTVANEMNRFGKAMQPMIDEAERERTAPIETKITQSALDSFKKGMSVAKTMPMVGEAIDSYSEYHQNKNIQEIILNNSKKDEEEPLELFGIDLAAAFQGDLKYNKNWREDFSERSKQIEAEYHYLDEETMAEIELIAKGINAEPELEGYRGWANAGTNVEKSYRQIIANGEAAEKRLRDKGYSHRQINKWSEMRAEGQNQEFQEETLKDLEAFAEEHPVLASAYSTAYKVATVPLDAVLMTEGAIKGDFNSGSAADTILQADEMLRSAVSEDIAEESKWGAWLYNVGMSGVDSAVAAVMPGGAYFLAADAATSTMRDLTERGLSTDEAFMGGIVAGVTEGLFEKISIGNFKSLQEVSPSGIKDVVKNVLKSTGVNASEEASTELANIIYDSVAHGDLSNYNQLVEKYIAQGMSPEDAKSKAFTDLALQVLEAGASGAVMGGGFGVTGSTIGYAKNYNPTKSAGTQAMDSGSVDAILDAAKLAPKGTRPQQAYEHVTKKQNKGKNLTAHDIGKVAVETQNYIRENTPELNGVFESAKTSEDVDALYNAERYRLDQMPVTPRSAIKALDADYKAAKSAIENYNTSGARAMLDGSLRNKTYSEADIVKTRKPTIGKTEAGEFVSVSSIENIEDGNITVKTSEGTTQELNIRKDIKSVDAQTLWTNAAQNFTDAASAQAFIDNYDGGSIADYTKAFKDYYHLAATGMTLSQINEHEIAPCYDLSNKAQAAAVEFGQKAISYQQGVVDLTARPKTKSQQLQVNMLDSIGKHIGMNVVVVDTMSKYDGFYRSGTNQIVIALDSSSGAILRTAGHETYHFVKEEMSDKAKNIENFVLDTLKKNKGEKWVNDRLEFYEKQGYKTKEAQVDELVADSLFDAFTNKRAVKDFATENQSLAKKLVTHIQKLLSDIKNIINKLVASGKYDEIKAWQDDVASLEKLNNMFLDVLDELAAKNTDTQTEIKSTSNEVKDSRKIYPDMSETERANVLKNTKLNVVTLVEENIKLSAEEITSLKDTYTKNASKIIFDLCKRFGVNKNYRNTNVDLLFNYSKRSVHKSINKASEIKADYLDFAKMLSVFDDVIENAVPVETHYDKYKGTSRENKNLAQDYVLFSAFKDGENIIPVEFNIKEFKSGNQNQLYVSVNLKKIEAGVLELLSDDEHPGGNSRPTSIYSLTEIIQKVNPVDGDFLKYVPDSLLNNRQKEAKTKALMQEHNKIERHRVKTDAEDVMHSAKREQLDIINETNPAPNSYNTWIRTVDDIKTLSETLEDKEWDYEEFNPDLTRADIRKAIRNGRITVYSSMPIENGVFVSPSRMEAESYSGNGKIYEKTVDINDVAWIDPTQGQFAKVDDIRYSSKRTVASGKKKSYNKSSYYNEFDSLAMRWRNKADTNIDDCKIISRGEDDFSLLKATEDGYIELARGKYKDVRAAYERAYEEAINEIYGNYESYGADEGRDVWNMQPSENGTDGFGYSEEVSGRGLQANASRSDEHSGESGREESVNYSTKRESSISEEASNYILDTKEYREVLGILERRFDTLGKVKLSPKAIDRYAGRLLQKSKSNYSREQLTERLTALFDFIANSREVTWEEVTELAANIAKDMLTESQTLDRSMQTEYADVLKLMRESRVYISPEVRAEINHNFGSLEAFRKRLGSKLKITVTDESAVPLDVFWRELAENRPEMFDADANYLDMPSKLVDFFEMTSPQYINPYNIEMDMDEAAYDFALQMYDEYFEIPEVKTEAQKYSAKLQMLKGHYNAKIKEIHNSYRERIKEIRTELKAENKKQIAVTKELYRSRNENYRNKQKETRDKQRLRAQIYRSAQNLTDKLVNPTDTKHIPQELISAVNDFCKTINESGIFSPEKANKLRRAFKNIGENSADPDANLSTMYNEEIAEMLEQLHDALAGRRLGELNVNELARVKIAASYFTHIVAMSNRTFSDNIKEKLLDLQSNAIFELDKISPDRKRIKTEIQKGLLKPVTFFELLESPTLTRLYNNIRQGEGKWYRTVASAKDRRQEAAKKYNYKSWKNDKVTFKPERLDGEIVLSVDEALSIYATANREQGVEHIRLGGIVREEDAKKKLNSKDKAKSVDVRSENIPITVNDMVEITSQLTKEQKAYADNLIEFMSKDMAALGNEVSMRLFGIKKFNEKKYFPLKSASNFIYSKPAVENDARIKHMSMTKQTTPKANNPVVIGNFTETVMNHCNDMALYYSFCLPLEDFNRVYNFKTQPTMFERPTSIKQKIDRAFGAKANGYIKQLLTDINGGVTQQAGAGVVNKMISLAKKNAVFGSLSVAVQQPSAVARAFLYIDPKCFVQSTFSKRDWNELKTYAPVAGVKEMGYFDTNIGRQAVDWMTEDKYEGLKEKAFALFKDGDYRDGVLSFLPAYMDQISWGHIWNAVKKETAHNNPDMDKHSEEFLRLAGERFTYVIDRTQVYDSVFARSEWMRSKDTGVKVATAFMSEPLTNYNMLYSAAVKARHGDKKFAAKAVSAYLVSVAFNSILKSLVTAGRDDDEDKSYWEKYLSDVVANFIDEPFGMIPYLKDFVSLMQGYDSSRMDTQVLADIVKTVQTVSDSDKTPYEKVKSVFGTFGIALGVPFKNLWRDSEMVVRTVEKIFKGEFEPTTEQGIINAIKEDIGMDTPSAYEQVVEAYLNSDDEHYNKVYDNLIDSKSEKAIETGIKSAAKDKFQSGEITEVEATRILTEILELSDNETYWLIDKWGETANGEDYAKYNNFTEAVRTGKDLKNVIDEYLDHGVEKKTIARQITKTFKPEYIELYRTDRAEASALRRRILDAYVALGYDRDDKADDIADWLE